ncbi:hypothetical protein HG530_009082 [Fusarium avenaceum]|nr:hypothetical protein HG530_009082 [Fusarium avenaceum]
MASRSAVGTFDITLCQVALLLGEDTIDPLIEELDDEFTKVAHELSLTIIDNLRHKLLLFQTDLCHLSVVVEIPLHDLIQLARVIKKLFLGTFELLFRTEPNSLYELVLIATDLLRTVCNALEPSSHLLMILESFLQRQHPLITRLLCLHHYCESHHEAVVILHNEIDEIQSNNADVLVEPIDRIVQSRKLVDLDHLLLDHLDRLLAIAQARHARLSRLELLAQTAAELAIHGALFA